MLKLDRTLQLLLWISVEGVELPEIDLQHLPYSTIQGNVRLWHYLRPFNRSYNCLYGRVKVRTSKEFEQIKHHVVEWLNKDLHCVKVDYIQAHWISNIILLTGPYNAVDIQGTRTALEQAVQKK